VHGGGVETGWAQTGGMCEREKEHNRGNGRSGNGEASHKPIWTMIKGLGCGAQQCREVEICHHGRREGDKHAIKGSGFRRAYGRLLVRGRGRGVVYQRPQGRGK